MNQLHELANSIRSARVDCYDDRPDPDAPLAGAITPSLAARQTFTTGVSPNSVTPADINGDGKPDLIVNDRGENVSVLLDTTLAGATTSSFSARQMFDTGGLCDAGTAADINDNGKPDLIATNQNNNTVAVLLDTTAHGAAAASFSAHETFPTGSLPVAVVATDVNSDGKRDLVVPNQSDNDVSVLLNATTPGAATADFAAQQTFPTGTTPVSITTADINADGRPDLIVVNFSDNTVSVLIDTTPADAPVPSFAAAQAFVAGSGTFSVFAADVDGDGKPDLIVTNFFDNTVSVLSNTTDAGAPIPNFAARQTFATGHGPTSLAARDVNGDGKPDLIVLNQTDYMVSVLLNASSFDRIFADGFE